MLGGQNYRNTKYSRYNEKGMDNPDWSWCSTVEMLTSFLNDPSIQSPDDKKLAADILSFCVERKKNDPHGIADFMNELQSNVLWESAHSVVLKEITIEGVTCREVVHLPDFTPPKQNARSTVPQVAPDPDEEI